MPDHQTTHGTELLAIDPAMGPPSHPPRLSFRLSARGSLVGPAWTVPARYARRDGVLRLAVDTPIEFEPGLACTLDGREIRLVAALDSLDASSRRRLARLLAAPGGIDSACIARRVRPKPVGLSPAARALLEELPHLERNRPGDLHVKVMEKAGRGPIARELVRTDLMLELAGGYVVGRAGYEQRLSSLPVEGGVTSQDASRLWGCSHGRARAILDRAVVEGDLLRDAKRYFSPEQPRA